MFLRPLWRKPGLLSASTTSRRLLLQTDGRETTLFPMQLLRQFWLRFSDSIACAQQYAAPSDAGFGSNPSGRPAFRNSNASSFPFVSWEFTGSHWAHRLSGYENRTPTPTAIPFHLRRPIQSAPVSKNNPPTPFELAQLPPATNTKSRTATRASSPAFTPAATIKPAFSTPAGFPYRA